MRVIGWINLAPRKEEISESINDKAHSPFRNECAVLTSPAAAYTRRPPEKYPTLPRHGVGSLFPLRTRLGSAILCEPNPSGSCLPLIQSAERLQGPSLLCTCRSFVLLGRAR